MKTWELQSLDENGYRYSNQKFMDIYALISMTEKISLTELKESLERSDKFVTAQWWVGTKERYNEKFSPRFVSFLGSLRGDK